MAYSFIFLNAVCYALLILSIAFLYFSVFVIVATVVTKVTGEASHLPFEGAVSDVDNDSFSTNETKIRKRSHREYLAVETITRECIVSTCVVRNIYYLNDTQTPSFNDRALTLPKICGGISFHLSLSFSNRACNDNNIATTNHSC